MKTMSRIAGEILPEEYIVEPRPLSPKRASRARRNVRRAARKTKSR